MEENYIQRVDYSIGSESGVAIVVASDRVMAASMVGEAMKDGRSLEIKIRGVRTMACESRPRIIYNSLAEQGIDCAEQGDTHHPFPSVHSLQQ